MSHAFFAGVAAGYGIAIPVGAIAVLIVLTSAHESFRQGFAAGLGAATADLFYASLAVTAGATLAHRLQDVRMPLHLAGGCVLTLIAARGLVRALGRRSRAENVAAIDPRLTYLRFVGLTLVNPLTVVYFASIVLGEQTATGPPRAAVFVLGVVVASASWQTLLAASGAVGSRILVDRGRVATALLGYGIVLALALRQFQQA